MGDYFLNLIEVYKFIFLFVIIRNLRLNLIIVCRFDTYLYPILIYSSQRSCIQFEEGIRFKQRLKKYNSLTKYDPN